MSFSVRLSCVSSQQSLHVYYRCVCVFSLLGLGQRPGRRIAFSPREISYWSAPRWWLLQASDPESSADQVKLIHFYNRWLQYRTVQNERYTMWEGKIICGHAPAYWHHGQVTTNLGGQFEDFLHPPRNRAGSICEGSASFWDDSLRWSEGIESSSLLKWQE